MNRKWSLLLAMLVLVSLILPACSSSSKNAMLPPEAPAYDQIKSDEPAETGAETGAANGADTAVNTGMNLGNNLADAGRMVAYTTNIRIQTEDFAAAEKKLQTLITESKAVIESREQRMIRGQERKLHRMEMTLLVPSKDSGKVVRGLQDLGVITNQEQAREDVTRSYSDNKQRLEALRKEQKRLQELIGKADKVEDMLQIESRLSELSYQIESFEDAQKNLKERVDYHTIHLTLSEVEVQRVDDSKKLPYKNRFNQRLNEGFNSFMIFIEDLGLWIAYNANYLIFGLAALLILVILWKLIRWPARRRKRKMKELELKLKTQNSEALEKAIAETQLMLQELIKVQMGKDVDVTRLIEAEINKQPNATPSHESQTTEQK